MCSTVFLYCYGNKHPNFLVLFLEISEREIVDGAHPCIYIINLTFFYKCAADIWLCCIWISRFTEVTTFDISSYNNINTCNHDAAKAPCSYSSTSLARNISYLCFAHIATSSKILLYFASFEDLCEVWMSCVCQTFNWITFSSFSLLLHTHPRQNMQGRYVNSCAVLSARLVQSNMWL